MSCCPDPGDPGIGIEGEASVIRDVMPISVGSPLGSSPSILLIFLVPPNLRTQLRKGKKRVKFEKNFTPSLLPLLLP
ncbi:hypothetical protein BDV09DRAFT_18175 [Aspergillus tetrazonus]